MRISEESCIGSVVNQAVYRLEIRRFVHKDISLIFNIIMLANSVIREEAWIGKELLDYF
jgi:hypothetical protein